MQIIYFVFVGGCGFVVHLMVYNIFSNLTNIHLAYWIGFLIAVHITYILNRTITFKSKKKATYLYYLIGQVKGCILNYMVFSLILLLAPAYYFKNSLALISGSIIGMVFNFIYARWLFLKAY